MKAVLFDLDGTLLNSVEDLANATNRTLAQFGFPTHPLPRYYHFIGDGMRNLILRALPIGVDENDTHFPKILEAMRTNYASSWAECSTPYPGICGMLERLNRSGIPLAVLSNKPHSFTVEVVNYFFGATPWACVEGAKERRPIKPDPTGALEIAEYLKLSPEDLAFVGDTSTDMQTAKRAGMISIGVTWGFRDEDELKKHGASHIAHSAEELVDLLLR